MTGAVKMWSRANWEQSGLITHQRPISLKDHRESSTDHRDTYGMTSKSLQMCPSRGNAKWHSRPSRDDGVERQDFFFRRDRRRCFILKVPGRCE